MRPILLLDVNETLLDLRALDPLFQRAFGDSALRPVWFSQMLQLSFVGIITSQYVDFETAQRAALHMLAERCGLKLDVQEGNEILRAMSTLPPHPDVMSALQALADDGFRLAALANSPLTVVEDQLDHARIRGFFERVLSADTVKRLKPAPEPYLMAASEFGVPATQTCLVAAHAWDVAGALAAGCEAAFVARSGMAPSPLGQQPTYVGRDLGEVATVLTEAAHGR